MARRFPAEAVARSRRRQHWAGVREKVAAEKEVVRAKTADLAVGSAAIVKVEPLEGEPITLAEVADKLRRAFEGAMLCEEFAPATQAAMALAKVGGLIVDRTAVVTASPDEFRGTGVDAERDWALARAEAKYGPVVAQKFKEFVERLQREAREAIDITPEDRDAP